jgi:hypothetical protein
VASASAVLGVHADEAAVVPRLRQGLEDRGVVHHEDARVGHEELEGRDALLAHHLVHVHRDLVAELAHDHVEAVVDHRLALGALHPALEGGVEPLTEVLDGEVDQGGGPAVGGGDGAALEVVGGGGAAEGHVEVGVHVDAPRHDQLAGGVDHRVGGHAEALADVGDHALVDVDVRVVAIGRGDHGTVLHEGRGHLGPLRCRRPGDGRQVLVGLVGSGSA